METSSESGLKLVPFGFGGLLPLPHRITGLAVEGVEMLGLDEINVGLRETLKQVGHVGVSERAPLRGHEPAAPVIGAEGFRQPIGPYLDTTIGDHGQGHGVAAG